MTPIYVFNPKILCWILKLPWKRSIVLNISFECSSSKASIRAKFSFIGIDLVYTAILSPLNVSSLFWNTSTSRLSSFTVANFLLGSSRPIFFFLHSSISIYTLLIDSSIDITSRLKLFCKPQPSPSAPSYFIFHHALIRFAASTFNCYRLCKRCSNSNTLDSCGVNWETISIV